MSDEKQYFDRLEVLDNYIWAVNEIDGTRTPLVISAIQSSLPSSYPTEIVLQQSDGPWWHSRKKFHSQVEIDNEISQITDAINRVGKSP